MRYGITVGTAAVFVAGLLFSVTGSAGAAPTPTLSEVQARLNKLNSESEKLDQQYDQVKEQLSATNQRLGLVDKQLVSFNAEFATRRDAITRIGIADYENGNVASSITLLTSGNPQKILNRSSILLELSAADNAQIVQLVDAARQLTNAERLASRTRAGIVQLEDLLAGRRAELKKVVSQETALFDELSPQQQADVGPGGAPVTNAKYTGPTKTQAEKAVAFAYAQLSCPYVYGGTGPCAEGFDCSGLTMSAWAYAGVSIPRTSYEQWDDLPHVSTLEPGDIMVFNGAGHVGIYVGNNELIDAPHTGAYVELVPFSGWYTETYDGAVAP